MVHHDDHYHYDDDDGDDDDDDGDDCSSDSTWGSHVSSPNFRSTPEAESAQVEPDPSTATRVTFWWEPKKDRPTPTTCYVTFWCTHSVHRWTRDVLVWCEPKESTITVGHKTIQKEMKTAKPEIKTNKIGKNFKIKTRSHSEHIYSIVLTPMLSRFNARKR